MAVQRVRRVIRKVDPWTVLKVSLIFNALMALAFVLGTVIFWAIFVNAGIPERVNELALLIGLENGINFEGAVYFRIVLLLSVIGTIMMTGFFTQPHQRPRRRDRSDCPRGDRRTARISSPGDAPGGGRADHTEAEHHPEGRRRDEIGPEPGADRTTPRDGVEAERCSAAVGGRSLALGKRRSAIG
jgi:hypothetical protein